MNQRYIENITAFSDGQAESMAIWDAVKKSRSQTADFICILRVLHQLLP